MALIICPDCGKEISDKASSCPNCGCPIEEVINESPKESLSFFKAHPKTVGLLLGIIAGLAAVFFIIFHANGTGHLYDRSGHFRNLEWDTSRSDVEELISGITKESPVYYGDYLVEHIEDFDGLNNGKSTVMYSFDGFDRLKQATVLIQAENYDSDTLYNKCRETFKKVYGKPTETDSMIKIDAITEWSAGDSKVELIHYNEFEVMASFSKK